MPIPTQIKLLRVLESHEITRVGSNEPTKVNVTDSISDESRFGKGDCRRHVPRGFVSPPESGDDQLPRLADRREDIPLLVDYFVKEHSKRHQKTIRGISTAARRRLLAFDWPGNVRQLAET